MAFEFGGTDGVFVVDWGDGDTNVYTARGNEKAVEILRAAHTYKKAGEFEVRIYNKPLDSEVPLDRRGYVETRCGDMVMVAVRGGSFVNDTNRLVSVKGFYIGAFEVTQRQWEAVMGTTVEQQRYKEGATKLYGVGDDYPMYYVNWYEANEFCAKLSELTGKKYRLPTDAEWEYAARGGQKADGTMFAGSNKIGEVAWYDDNSGGKTHPVGQKKPNGLGLYDMSGNVGEWSLGLSPSGSYGVRRGGSWNDNADDCRVSYRDYYVYGPGHRFSRIGFRVVCVP